MYFHNKTPLNLKLLFVLTILAIGTCNLFCCLVPYECIFDFFTKKSLNKFGRLLQLYLYIINIITLYIYTFEIVEPESSLNIGAVWCLYGTDFMIRMALF